MSCFSRLLTVLTAALCVSLLSTTTIAAPPEAGPQSARLDTYAVPGGASYFSLSLAPSMDIPAADAHDVVVLFDTSASQVGAFREKALTALDTLLRNLDDKDRVRLLAIDLNAVSLGEAFVGPRSNEMRQSIARLKKRVPLGSTNLSNALRAAVQAFENNSAHARTVVYIGDGMSKAHLLQSDSFSRLVIALAEQRISVSSYAVGPQIDSQILAVLANQTGGNLAVDSGLTPKTELADGTEGVTENRARLEDMRQASQVGAYLADAVRGAVLWPVSVDWPKQIDEVFPRAMPPLRNDRDSIVIGTGKFAEAVEVKVSADQLGKTVNLAWTIPATRPSDDHVYLAQLVDMARRDGGVTLPTVGSAGLRETRRMINAGARNLTSLARHAMATGNDKNAKLLASEALRRDPGNPIAQAVARGAGKVRPAVGSSARPTDLRLVNQAPETPEASRDGALLDSVAGEGAFLDAVEEQNRVIADQIKTVTEAQLKDARERMASDPEGVTGDLKLMLDGVRRAPELDAELRSRLVDQIESTLKEASRREIERDEELRLAQEAVASARERRQIVDRLALDQEKRKQLMDRLGSLIDERRYQEAEEGIGPELESLDPFYARPSVITVAATLNARLGGHLYETMVARTLRHKGFYDTMHQVELSSIPFPDEPPIVYPDAPVWEDLTNRRKKYASVDLKKRGGAEERITQELDENTNFEFIETPLRDVVEYLKDLHSIEIQVDQKALDDVGIGTDTPITRNLKGISLRSALRLMLRELDLTYVIRDEVLQITTPEQVENHLTTKVYPVADLVLPIPENSFGGIGGQIGGQGGGMGGGGGGGFGGGGGGGGFGGGGMGGGGGGGFFNVADDVNAEVKSEEKQSTDLRLFRSDRKTAGQASAKKPVSTKPAEKTSASKKAKPIKSIKIDESVAADVFWNDYFARNREDAQTVRKAMRELLAARKLDHVVALCRGALRNGQPQPWMYESMGLAMQASGQPKEEIERALMSAADFGGSSETLHHLALYLSRSGLEDRALEVYRQVLQLDPLRREAYSEALRIAASRENNLEAIQWTTIGVLSQSWPVEHQEIRQRAFRLAQATLERLKKEKHPEEFAEYQKQLDQAVVRDCVVRVSWTGDADIDLIVEEPSGTICSRRNSRTTSGGVLLGDSYSQHDKKSQESSEYYVCPSGFSGSYRVVLRRVWGKVTAGKVTVDVYRHYRTDQVQHERKQISLGENDSLIVFDLDKGRRQQPLAQQQIANAAKGQMAIGRAILAQQLTGLSDPRIGQEIARRRGSGPRRGNGDIDGPGAVGFQPVIIVLPEGTNLGVTGVISADRRYVRITAMPLFSSIGDVTNFTFSGGFSDPGAAGNNGGGGGGGDLMF